MSTRERGQNGVESRRRRVQDEAASAVSFSILSVEETKELRARNARCDYILNECDAQRRSSED